MKSKLTISSARAVGLFGRVARRTSYRRGGRFARLLLATVGLSALTPALAAPPYAGTIFLEPNVITAADPSTFVRLEDAGQGSRVMFDRRANAFVTLNAYLFTAFYSDGLQAEVQVNPEFGSVAAARAEAATYAPVIGRLPNYLRVDVQTVWIHQGVKPFGGGNNNLLIHTGQAADYVADGILEETLFHEATHTSMDARHAEAPGWLAAQAADGEFISTYARDNPLREDVAESLLPYYALRYKRDRISQENADTFAATIPNRIAYFDALRLDTFKIPRAHRRSNSRTAGSGQRIAIQGEPKKRGQVLRIAIRGVAENSVRSWDACPDGVSPFVAVLNEDL